jgi:hypothetical protein
LSLQYNHHIERYNQEIILTSFQISEGVKDLSETVFVDGMEIPAEGQFVEVGTIEELASIKRKRVVVDNRGEYFIFSNLTVTSDITLFYGPKDVIYAIDSVCYRTK